MEEMKRRGSIDEPKVSHSVYFDAVSDVRAHPKRRGLPVVFLTRPAHQSSAPADYYEQAQGKTGEALKRALHDTIDDHRELSYSEVWEALKATDEDPANRNNVILLYSRESRSKQANGGQTGDWNREHVWAKSHGDFGTSKGPGDRFASPQAQRCAS